MVQPFLPNEADAFNANQAEPDSVDFEILLLGHQRTGVLSGCAVTESSPAAQTVDVAVGEVVEIGEQITVAVQADVAVSAADGTNPRIDLITVNSAGTVVVTAGTAAAQPVAPAIPASSVPLAFLYVPTSDNTHADNQINDKRVFVQLGVGVMEVTVATILTATSPPIINAETTSGNYIVDLPDNAAAAGRWFTLRREGLTNWVQLDAVGSDTFSDGTGLHRLDFDGTDFTVYSVGDGEWKIARAMVDMDTIDPQGNPLVRLIPQGDAGDGASTGGVLLIDNTGSTAPAIVVFSNQTAQGANDPLMRISANSTSFAQGVLELINNGTVGAAFNLKLEGASPQIEFEETDQASPAGKFEIQVQSNQLKITSRNTGDSAFENILFLDQLADGGRWEWVSNVPYIAWGASGAELHAVTTTPEAALTAPVGSLVLRDDGGLGTVLYYKASGAGNTGWRPVGTGAKEESGAVTLDWEDGIVNIDTAGGAVVITLPDVSAFTGKNYLIRRDGANTVTIDRAGSDTFDDADIQKTLDSDSAAIGIFSIGDTEWKIVATEGTVGGS